jgi:anti-sigma factor RsiW
LTLDALRTGGGTAAEQAHLAGCEACRAELRALEALASRLRGLERAAVVPPGVDAAILAPARRELGRRRRAPATRLLWRVGAAAALLLAVGLGAWLGRGRRGPEVAGDIDRSGRVDILDAHALALAIASGRSQERGRDVNGDGAVDRADVDLVARESVSLTRRVP